MCYWVRLMQIRVGYELIYDCPQPTPMILTLNIHYSRASDLVKPDHLQIQPSVPIPAPAPPRVYPMASRTSCDIAHNA